MSHPAHPTRLLVAAVWTAAAMSLAMAGGVPSPVGAGDGAVASPAVVRDSLTRLGYSEIGLPRLRGAIYVVEAVDPAGQRLVVVTRADGRPVREGTLQRETAQPDPAIAEE